MPYAMMTTPAQTAELNDPPPCARTPGVAPWLTVWLAAAILLSFGCRTQNRSGHEWTVLSPSEGRRIVSSAGLAHLLSGSWAPTPAEVLPAEAKLTRLLEDESARLPRGNATVAPDGYYRQYAGAFRDGRRVLILNGIERDYLGSGRKDRDWRKVAIIVADGGQGYFVSLYDVENRRFDWFRFNGPLRGGTPSPGR